MKILQYITQYFDRTSGSCYPCKPGNFATRIYQSIQHAEIHSRFTYFMHKMKFSLYVLEIAFSLYTHAMIKAHSVCHTSFQICVVTQKK